MLRAARSYALLQKRPKRPRRARRGESCCHWLLLIAGLAIGAPDSAFAASGYPGGVDDATPGSVSAGGAAIDQFSPEAMTIGPRVQQNETIADVNLADLLNVKLVTATKTERTLERTPANVSIVTKEEIAQWGYTTIAELLQHLAGFYLVDDHITPNVGVRGIAGGLFDESSSIKVLINGTSVAFRATSGNWLGAELVPMSAIERVEVVRGPTSALYGADAFFGVVNIILRAGEKFKGVDAKAGGNANGKHLGYDGDASGGAKVGPVEFMLGARLYREDRSGIVLPDSSPAPSIPAYQQGRTASDLVLESKTGLGRLTYHFDRGSEVSLFGSVASASRGAEFSPWQQLSKGVDSLGHDAGTVIALYQGQAGLSGKLVLSRRLSFEGRAVYFTGGPMAADHIEVGNDLSYVKRQFSYRGVETSLESHWEIVRRLTAVAGAEYVFDDEDLPAGLEILKVPSGGLQAGDALNPTATQRSRKSLTNLGAFAQLLWTPVRRYLDLVGGLRYDHQNIYGSQVSGRLAGTSSPWKPLSLKLIYSSAYKAPSPLLLFATPYRVGDIIGNPDLKPQYVHSVEGQILYTPTKRMRITTGVAYTLVLNRAEFAQQGVNLIARNLARVESLTWENEVLAQLAAHWTSYLRFELVRTRRDIGSQGYLSQLMGSDSVIYPPFLLRAGLSGTAPVVPIRLAVEGILVGPRRASESNTVAHGGEYQLPSYVMLDASLSTEALRFIRGHSTRFMLKGRNLLGAKGPDPGYGGVDYPLAPRTILLTLQQDL